MASVAVAGHSPWCCLLYTSHSRHAQFIGANADTRLLMKTERKDNNGRNYRYTQTFRGIPIFAQGLVVSEDSAGNVRAMFGNMISGLEQDLSLIHI